MKSDNSTLVVILVTLLVCGGCADELTQADAGGDWGSTTAYFAPDADHPERSLLPLPNILAVNEDHIPPSLSLLPSQCLEAGSASEALLQQIEQKLNGFGTYSRGSIMAYFGAEVDLASLPGKVLLLDLGAYEQGGKDADLENPLPLVFSQARTPKYISGCSAEPALVPTVFMVPVNEQGLPVVLAPDHLYGVALLEGVKDTEGYDVLPSYVWTLVRSAEASSDLQVRLLQETHKPLLAALDALGHSREEIVLGWMFNTEVTDRALKQVQGQLGLLGDAYESRAVTIPAADLPVPPLPPQQFLGALGLSCEAIGAGPNCPGISLLLTGQFVSPRYQQAAHLEPPYLALEGGREWVPGTFSSEFEPQVQGQAGEVVPFLASLPAVGSVPYPVVIFQHPLTPTDPAEAASANKLALLSLANNLGAAGFAMVAIDGVLAGGRAVLVQNALSGQQQLFPVMSSDLFATRDNIRQTVIDLLQLVRVLKNCTAADCGGLEIDPARIHFLGTSLGAVSGALFAALSPDLKRVVLNAPLAGVADAIAGSPVLLAELSPAICAAGIVSAACCGSQPPLCSPQDLAEDAGFAQFLLTAQWILDPADPVNYAGALAAQVAAGVKRVLVQQADGDQVFPNSASALLAGLLGLGPDEVKSYDPGDCSAVPQGAHTMLLQNCGMGTVNMRTDLIQFLMAP